MWNMPWLDYDLQKTTAAWISVWLISHTENPEIRAVVFLPLVNTWRTVGGQSWAAIFSCCITPEVPTTQTTMCLIPVLTMREEDWWRVLSLYSPHLHFLTISWHFARFKPLLNLPVFFFVGGQIQNLFLQVWARSPGVHTQGIVLFYFRGLAMRH